MSEPNPISRYQEAMKAHNDAIARADRLASNISEAGRILSRWREVMFANTNVGFPAELALNSRSPSINVQSPWPTLQEMAEAAAAYHSTKHDFSNAWAAIPQDQRVGLQPPPR